MESPEALLKNEAGVDLAITPGGAVDRIVMRGIPEGFSGNTTQYLLNGMPVDPLRIATNRTVWHRVSSSDIERLEVVRGPASALYGANAMGGVINIITKRGAGAPYLQVDLADGSHDGHVMGLEGGGRYGNLDLLPLPGHALVLGASVGSVVWELEGEERYSANPDWSTSAYVTSEGAPCTLFPCYRQYQNIAAIQVEGAELILSSRLAAHWRPFFNYTLTLAQIRDNEADPLSEGNSPAYSPRHKANLGAAYLGKRGFSARMGGATSPPATGASVISIRPGSKTSSPSM